MESKASPLNVALVSPQHQYYTLTLITLFKRKIENRLYICGSMFPDSSIHLQTAYPVHRVAGRGQAWTKLPLSLTLSYLILSNYRIHE